ncbi:phage terminase small subunit P27 family [Streptomyces sp. 378]|uniref:phage terminase small subunit P27 family n=1 Tax=Streptomyces sp. 378 TaxID=3049412 RepID=UPI0024C45AF3|nr:phage terminase small subunit P27 family [Streptomyces sp. 378]MDK1348016.1 phage terminase small subunit P27 family [Streptomyces sp. 378]
MGKRGPAPKPTALKLLHGDDKKNPQRINRGEPVPAVGDVQCPEWLPERAADVWDRLAPDLIDKHVLTPWDVDAFAALCSAVVINQDAAADIDTNGTTCTTVVRELADGTLVYDLRRNPAVQVFRESSTIIASLGGRFGLTPSDRAQLKISPPNMGAGAERLLT